MKKIDVLNSINYVGGGMNVKSAVCSGAFVYTELVMGATLALAGVTAGISLGVGAVIGIGGAIVCSYVK